MKWRNLKNNKCPQCGKDWAFTLKSENGMMTHGCGFKIRESRYQEIVSDMVIGEGVIEDNVCPICGAEMIREIGSTDIDGNRQENHYVCPNCD